MNKLENIKSDNIQIEYKENFENNISNSEHYHDAYEISFFVKANIEIFAQKNKYKIKDGDILFIKEYDLHRIVYCEKKPYIRFVLNVKKEFLTKILDEFKITYLLREIEKRNNKKIATNLEQKNEFNYIFKRLNKVKNINSNNNKDVKKALLKSNMVTLITQLHNLLRNQSNPKKTIKEEHVESIIYYLDNNYIKEITLDKISQKFNLNKYYISHIFKEITGFTIIEYLQHIRIIHAQKLLENSEKEIVEISSKCGFNNLQHFYRVFKKITKTTPYRFKKN